MKDLTPYQKLALVKAYTGYRIQLQEFESLAGCMFSVDMVILLINTAKFSAARGSVTIRATGMRTVTITRSMGGWTRPDSDTTWLDTDTTVRVVSDPPHTSAYERKLWEELCYRPGSAAQPRDSFARQQQGYYED